MWVKPNYPIIYSAREIKFQITQSRQVHEKDFTPSSDCEQELQKVRQELNKLRLQEVSKQQTEFGETE